ncbi:auxin-responsive protein IAA11 [Neltuma alba]|uniref:auxin-responsive protein IAA11 n=1 Tax=Neltuma alba TaxID=207710 RepID=UPI0010A398D2|nr:auxin-responsive protein IAA11-like [Prosopis alba]
MQSGSTVSKEDNLVMSSEDSSCPDEADLELGLGLSLSRPPGMKSQPPSTNQFARILTAKDFPSMVSSRSATSLASSTSSSSSSSSSPSSVTRPNATAGTKRTADSVVAANGPSQVVGWPPVGAYRMNSFNNHAKSTVTNVFNSVTEKSKSNNTEARRSTDNGIDNSNANAKGNGHLKSSSFVKVNVDGLPIGRKVDLSAHNSYESLALALEEMFDEHAATVSSKRSNGEEHGVIVGGAERRSKWLDGSSKFVLTYEDKDGDWMLVGDVPWGMFLSSVRRLRIMRTSEANGLAPKSEEKNSRQRSLRA